MKNMAVALSMVSFVVAACGPSEQEQLDHARASLDFLVDNRDLVEQEVADERLVDYLTERREAARARIDQSPPETFRDPYLMYATLSDPIEDDASFDGHLAIYVLQIGGYDGTALTFHDSTGRTLTYANPIEWWATYAHEVRYTAERRIGWKFRFRPESDIFGENAALMEERGDAPPILNLPKSWLDEEEIIVELEYEGGKSNPVPLFVPDSMSVQ